MKMQRTKSTINDKIQLKCDQSVVDYDRFTLSFVSKVILTI